MARPVAMSTRVGTRLAGGGSVTPFRHSRRGRRRAACRPIIRVHEWTFRCLAVGRTLVGPKVGRDIGRDSPPRPSLDLRIGCLVGRSAVSVPYERTGRGSDRLTCPGCCVLGKAVGLLFGPVQAFLGLLSSEEFYILFRHLV